MLDDDARRRLTSAYTLPQPAPVDTSTGPSGLYLDGVALLLSHRDDWRAWLEAQLIDTDGSTLWPVAQGQSGALLLGILGRGTLHAWGAGRRMGPQWRNLPPPNTTQVALIDDCLFSGATMRELTAACQQNGWHVVKQIICALRDGQ
jgi:hypothetical protein